MKKIERKVFNLSIFGFTLVELLAIIVVLTTIMIIVLPKFSSSVNDRKQKEYNKLIKTLENAGKIYHSYNQEKSKVSINELVKQNLLTTGIKSPIDNTLISGCIFFETDESGLNKYVYQKYCNNGEIILKIDLDGGIVDENVSGGYDSGTNVILPNPTKQDYSFIGWKLIEGDSVVNGNSIVIGTKLTKLKAMYNSGNAVVLFDSMGGNVSTVSKSTEVGKKYGELPVPIKIHAIFKGWYTEKTGGTKVDENTIVTQIGQQTLYAHWEDTMITYIKLASNYSCNGVTVGDPLFTYTGECEVIDDSGTGIDNWRVKFKTSGKLSLKIGFNIDLFLVGGGSEDYSGIAATYKNLDLQNSEYNIVVGNANEKTYFDLEGVYYAPSGGTELDGNILSGSGKGMDAHEDFMCGGYDEYYNCTWGTWPMTDGEQGGSYGNDASYEKYRSIGQLSLSSVNYPKWGGQTTCEFNEGTKDGCTRGDAFAYSPGKGGNSKKRVAALSDGKAGKLGKGLNGDNSGAPLKSGIVVIRNTR
ncbi:MAG: InlB B-repeat-containing protein [Tenericutes bacterium]|nr:InlB B-repeat-containing protein [Mycoplasmatota bacterium]